MPLARHDPDGEDVAGTVNYFYSHASCEAWPWILFNRFPDMYFYSHASCEAWPKSCFYYSQSYNFYSHASCEAWQLHALYFEYVFHFYSHASCEAWLVGAGTMSDGTNFYSHASCEAWLCLPVYLNVLYAFLLTCLLRGMTAINYIFHASWHISTHMPLARHDSAATFIVIIFL